MKALYTQIAFELERFNVKENDIETLFIGGGTPSTVEPELYKDIFTLLSPFFTQDIEITTEANPNSASYQWLEGMQKLGVNRISFGVQSFNDEKLKKLGRAHTSDEAKNAITNANKLGINNISLDLIYAVLGDNSELLENDLRTAFSLEINHLSAYSLTIEEGTVFEKRPKMSHEQLRLTKELFTTIKEAGFEQYEISNFGTYQSQHNLGYWRYKDYIGAGAGAVGFLKDRRYYPQKDIESYIDNPLHVETESLSKEDITTEKVFLGFRCITGVDASFLSSSQINNAELLVEEDKLDKENEIYYNKDYLLSDEIALFVLG